MHNKDTKDQVNPSKIFLFIKTYWQNFARFHCLTAECTENEKNLVRPKKWIDFCVYLKYSKKTWLAILPYFYE